MAQERTLHLQTNKKKQNVLEIVSFPPDCFIQVQIPCYVHSQTVDTETIPSMQVIPYSYKNIPKAFKKFARNFNKQEDKKQNVREAAWVTRATKEVQGDFVYHSKQRTGQCRQREGNFKILIEPKQAWRQKRIIESRIEERWTVSQHLQQAKTTTLTKIEREGGQQVTMTGLHGHLKAKSFQMFLALPVYW
jgi:hypothetical protein